MCRFDGLFPDYGFAGHKGYASAAHIEAIRTYGLSSVHRRSFCSNFLQERLFEL
jgi:ribonuclease HII